MLTQAFFDRMKPLLGDAFDAFTAALEEEPVRAFRINTVKADFDAKAVFPSAEKLSYAKEGYVFSEAHIGTHPYHHAGAIYVQDPGAMSAVAALPLNPGDRVLDLCAAPGGKSSQAACLTNDAALLANEYVPARAKITVGNFERLGLKNAAVVSSDTAVFRELYRDFFDAVIVDAPCSGEGMFRKSDAALADWSVENVLACAERQRTILDNAAPLVREGGYLLYSTCTYAPEENELQVAAFLDRHPDYDLVPVSAEVAAVTSDGLPLVKSRGNLALCRRFYPHVSRGEGQFCALLQRTAAGAPAQLLRSDAKPLAKTDLPPVRAFLSDVGVKLPEDRLTRIGDSIVLLPDGFPLPTRSVFLAGVTVAEVRGKNLFPHHQFVSAFGREYARKVELSLENPLLAAYLHGEEIPTDAPCGFAAVTVDGFPVGGGKVSGGVLKNHYPKGLRNF